MKETQRRFAIVIGVSAYEGDDTRDLRYTINDAKRIGRALEAFGDFKPDDLYLLCDDPDGNNEAAAPPTRADIIQKLQYVADSASSEDLILFFFAGHGAEVSQTPYLLTCDTRLDVLGHTAINVATVNEILEASKAKCIIRIFDACRTSFGVGRFIGERMTQGLEDALFSQADGWVTISSCSSGEIAHEDGRFEQGVFSHYLCEGLEGKAAEEDGSVTLDGLVKYVRISVQNWSTQQTQRQTPHVQYDISGSLILTRVEQARDSAPTDPEQPLGLLETAIDAHLASTASDARNLQFTDEEQYNEVSSLVFDILRRHLGRFGHTSYTVAHSETQTLPELAEWVQCKSDIRAANIRPEYAGQALAQTIMLQSKDAVLPSTRLVVSLLRFSFFYWLWYSHSCMSTQFKTAFQPEPGVSTGSFVITSTAGVQPVKVDAAIRELLKRHSETLLMWADQLRTFVEATVKPLGKLGPIIE